MITDYFHFITLLSVFIIFRLYFFHSSRLAGYASHDGLMPAAIDDFRCGCQLPLY
jgi:hypothetical protein